MKTIAELNSRWWYRLLKVIYILTFLSISIAILIYGAYKTRPTIDNEKTVATCSNGKMLSFQDNYVRYAYENKDSSALMKMCGDSNGVQVAPVYTSFKWFAFLKGCSVLLAILFLFLELIRRIFYYIILGSLRPKKNESNSILS